MSRAANDRLKQPVRFVTASSLFDGHDASINIIRRVLQASGAEVIHLGHNRSASEIVQAAIQEDVDGIAISSYQGGHLEFFKYCYDILQEKGAGHIQIFGGGGGVITPSEIRELHEYGITRIFSAEDGQMLGLQEMVEHMMKACREMKIKHVYESTNLNIENPLSVAHYMTMAECGILTKTLNLKEGVPVLGITGTGGAGKSSLTDEIVRRFLRQFPHETVAILSVDPTKRKTGGALLGDRIRMNAIYSDRVFMRSIATRDSRSELSTSIGDMIDVAKAAQYDLIIVETSGIGQGDAAITDVSDVSLYVMTSEYGAPSQLEKIDMIDYADAIAINKFDRIGSDDALMHVRKQYQRSHERFSEPLEVMPVYGTIASRFNDRGTNELFTALFSIVSEKFGEKWRVSLHHEEHYSSEQTTIIPPERTNYLREIVAAVRSYQVETEKQAAIASKLYQLKGANALTADETINKELQILYEQYEKQLHPDNKRIIEGWPALQAMYAQEMYTTTIRGKEITTELKTVTLSGLRIPKVALPKFSDWGDILRWMRKEGVPGSFPYTAGVFPFKRKGEEPKRQFAGEGTPERTNLRFHYLSKDDVAKRLSTAFDSVTLYGEDPDERPDIYGKIGESGVSICTLDDMKELYAGFDLCAPTTSVSMTINGPAPIILAMFLNTAIAQQVALFKTEHGKEPTAGQYEQIRRKTLETVRGTVQADILKEDQGQNTCIFSTEFALRMMGDIQEFFIDHRVQNYYSVSISGYHIAEAGANPITQLAFTLANAFTYVEYYLSRGMKVDEFAPNFSFFFSNGLDPEYAVIGRIARRIWATVMKEKYRANERSQKLKYHIQTSGRSLHAQEIDFNDIRTTLQALMAIYDHCNSLHTNAYDEAITTPSEQSVRRAMAIQKIITQELGLAKNENPLQGSFMIEELTDLLEEAVLQELERIDTRGGVLGAMEMQYQRGKIQEESLYYEMKKHSGELPIIGVNTYLNPSGAQEEKDVLLARATKTEKDEQINRLRRFQQMHAGKVSPALIKLQETAVTGGNIFAELMETVKVASLGQITSALYEVGGQYRRNM